MKKDYTFKNREEIPFLYDSSIEETIKNYKTTLLIASNLILQFLNAYQFSLKLITEEYTSNYRKIIFQADSNKKTIYLTIIDDIIMIKTDTETFCFRINWDKYQSYARLTSYTKKQNNNIITQKIDNHYLYIEILVNNKKYYMEIPYDIKYYLDTDYFNMIHANTSIIDLRRIYHERFFSGQTPYEKNLTTTLSISLTDFQGKEILLDKLVMVNGFVDSYLLSTLKNQTQIIIKGSFKEENEITIKNYQRIDEWNIDEEIRKLYDRSRKIYLLK